MQFYFLQETFSDTVAAPSVAENTANQEPAQASKYSIIEATEQIAKEIEPLLEPEAVTEIVIDSLTRLPRCLHVSVNKAQWFFLPHLE